MTSIYRRMHSLSASFVLAYHGCERDIGEKLLRYEEPFLPSENAYDWLGSGIYFWEANPGRAHDWAVHHAERIKQKTGSIVEPFVVGAVIDLILAAPGEGVNCICNIIGYIYKTLHGF